MNRKEITILFLYAMSNFVFIIAAILIYVSQGALADRFFNITNAESRIYTWKILLEKFWENPIFGGIGWWETSSYIEQYAATHGHKTDIVASSAHNSYVAFLAEAGVIGTAFVFGSIFMLAYRVIKDGLRWVRKDKGEGLLMLFSGSAVIGFFAREFFEGTFLRGIFSFNNTALLLVISLALVVSKNKRTRSLRS